VAKKEAKTDLWVYDLLKEAGISLEPQGSTILEINEALKTASKSGSGNVGFPEYVGVVSDFLLVIENKADVSKHVKQIDGVISCDIQDVKSYAVNGALFYAQHLAKNTSYKKIITFGISGDEKKHRISPIYVDETEYYRDLPDVESFISFTEKNIQEYYIREVLKENTDKEKELSEILRDAAELHEDLRNYGNLKDVDKPLVVSGVLLALREAESKNFSIDDLTGDNIATDGQKILNAIESNLKRSKVAPEVKRDKLLSLFSLFKNSVRLNEVNPALGKTPLKHFTEFLSNKIYKSIKYTSTSEDYLGRFYGEFMSYSGGDGQTLGIVLTPKHITDLFCDLVEITVDDVVLDPCAGTAGFLISAMHHMLAQTEDESVKKKIRQEQLHGIEDQEYMFTIATTNMILRGDGKSNLINGDFLSEMPSKLQLKGSTVGMMNPPYSQGSKQNPKLYEISFTEHLLDSLTVGARAIVIVPQSSVTGKTNEEKAIKVNIFKKHTLEGVITLNKDTFYGVGTMPCIAVFTAGETHPKNKTCKFIDFRDDGYKVSPHIGLMETERAKDRKQHLLDVWFDRVEAETNFCVKTTVEADDEWLHSFYYFNDEIPTDADFEKTISDYLTFEFSMIMQGREYLFESQESTDIKRKKVENLENKNWKGFLVSSIFKLDETKRKTRKQIPTGANIPNDELENGSIPRITVTSLNNGINIFCNSNHKNLRTFNNFISVSFLATVFYHPYTASLDMKVHCLQIKDRSLDRGLGLFIAQQVRKSISNASYGDQISSTDMPRKKILLPIDDFGNPDFDYMTQYMMNLEQKMRKKYVDYIEGKIINQLI
jgi:type I restriction-modification system DNA methylase subunit